MHRLFVLRLPVLWEKSRELGATWLALFLFDHQCLFHDWKKFLWISHTADAVDRSDDPDSLFWKIQFVHDHLPDWMSRHVTKKKSGFKYPATHSSTNGAATTERAGVGGRATAVGLDEFSKQRDDFKILGQTADTGPQLFIGTHYGVGTAFYGLTQRPDMHKEVMHWSQHPHKNKGLYRYDAEANRVEVLDPTYEYPPDFGFVKDGTPTGGPFPGLRSPWYDAECRRRNNARDVAMHLDINPSGSASQWYSPLTIDRLKRRCVPPVWEGELYHERASGTPTRFVRVEGGRLKLWFVPGPEEKVPPGEYGIGADLATGGGATPTCFAIGRLRTGEKVGEYLDPGIKPEPAAALAVALGRAFRSKGGREAQLVWEHKGPGLTFGQTVLDLGYKFLWYAEDVFDYESVQATSPGWNPAPSSKYMLHDDYRAALDGGLFSNPSARALDQCLGYRFAPDGGPEHPGEKNKEDPAAGRINHGDMVVADALLWMLSKGGPGPAAKKVEEEVPYMSLNWRRQLRRHEAREHALDISEW